MQQQLGGEPIASSSTSEMLSFLAAQLKGQVEENRNQQRVITQLRLEVAEAKLQAAVQAAEVKTARRVREEMAPHEAVSDVAPASSIGTEQLNHLF